MNERDEQWKFWREKERKKMRKERSELLALAALFVLSPAGISPCLTAAVTGRCASESVLDPLACCNSQQLCPRLLFGLGVLFASFFDWKDRNKVGEPRPPRG